MSRLFGEQYSKIVHKSRILLKFLDRQEDGLGLPPALQMKKAPGRRFPELGPAGPL